MIAMARLFVRLVGIGLCAASAHGSEKHLDLVNKTPCLFEYRLWLFGGFRQSPTFKVPDGLTAEQCDDAKAVNDQIEREQAEDSARDEEQRKRDEAAAAEARERKRRREAEADAAAAAKFEADQSRALAAMRAQAAKAKAERDALARRPPAQIGMTRQQVLNETHWGRPLRVLTTTTADGVTERWVYGSLTYLVFENGKLVLIQN